MNQKVCVVGSVGTDPVEKLLNDGVYLCSFRVAENSRYYSREKNAWVDGDTSWYQVDAFRSIGENAKQSFKKGDRVIVFGKLRIKSWEHDGRHMNKAVIEADALGHDVRFGTSSFVKREFEQQNSSGDGFVPAAEGETADLMAV